MSSAHQSSRRSVLITAVVFVVLVALGYGWYKLTRPPSRAVRVGYLPMISSLTYFVALDQKFFVDEGLEVAGIPIQTSNDIAKSLQNHDIDVAVELAVVPLLLQVSKDPKGISPFVIFSTSAITEANGFDGVIVRADSPWKELKELSGKKVAVFPGSTAERTLLDVFAAQNPGMPPPIPMKMAPTLHLGALERKEVDAVHAYEPFLSVGLVEKGCRKLYSSLYAAQQSPNPIGVAALDRKWYDERTTTARSVIRALDRAAEFIAAYPDKAKMIATTYTGMSPEVIKVANIMPMSQSTAIDVAGLNKYFVKLQQMKETSSVPEAERLCLPQ